jgi:hypothetical protein
MKLFTATERRRYNPRCRAVGASMNRVIIAGRATVEVLTSASVKGAIQLSLGQCPRDNGSRTNER